MSKRIFIGGLSYSATEADIHELLEPYGEAQSVAMINDRDTGRFRGFCFVEMDDETAAAAIEGLDGTELDGRTLRVNEARPREQRPGGGGGGGGRGRGGDGGGGGGGRRRPDSRGDRGSGDRGERRRW